MMNNSIPQERWAVGEVRWEDGRAAEVSIQQTNAGYRMDTIRMEVAEVVALLRQGHRVYAIWHGDAPGTEDLEVVGGPDGTFTIEVADQRSSRKLASLPGFPEPRFLTDPTVKVIPDADLG